MTCCKTKAVVLFLALTIACLTATAVETLSDDPTEPYARAAVCPAARLLVYLPTPADTLDRCTALFCHAIANTVPSQGDSHTQ